MTRATHLSSGILTQQGGRMLNFIDRHWPLVFTAMILSFIFWAMSGA